MAPMNARWINTLWIALLGALSAGLTVGFTCVAPFAALGAAAAMTLPGRQALVCAIGVWLANQTAGFVVMSYPWTLNTIGWGAAIGVATVAGMLAAQRLPQRSDGLRSTARVAAGFAVAFAVNQAILYAAAASVLGGVAAFAPGIIVQVLGVNVVAFIGLWGLWRLLAVAVGSYRRRVSASPARFA
jgi:hypothetical protein